MAASASPNLTDPVFGLIYRPDNIRFDPAPHDLLVTCPAMANDRLTRELWIYGRTSNEGKTYLIVGGFYASRPPAPPKLETDPKGAIIEFDAVSCTLLGPAREVLQYPDDLLTQTVLRALVADLVRRYRTAFGGKVALDAALMVQHAMPAGQRDAPLRDALATVSN
jgi:hypothetical protein